MASKEKVDDIQEIVSIVEKSGNAFHCRVAELFKKNGWTNRISPYYNDRHSDKPREIDIIAEKLFPVEDRLAGFVGHISVRLYIECKYMNRKTVVWFHDRDEVATRHLVETKTPCRSDNRDSEKHHYYRHQRVAKLFADEKAKDGGESEVFYKALNQTLNACIHQRGGQCIVPKDKYVRRIGYTLHYPIIVCNSFDNVYMVNMDNADPPKKIADHFQLEVNYAYVTKSGSDAEEYFLIDVVDVRQLDRFLAAVDQDASVAGYLHFYR